MASELIDAVRAANRRFMELFAQGDAAGVAGCYSEAAQFLPPNADALRGRAAIAAAIGGLRDMGIRAVALDTLEVEGAGDSAWGVGRYSLKLADGTVADHGKDIVIWKREGGAWRLHRDIFNSSLPAS